MSVGDTKFNVDELKDLQKAFDIPKTKENTRLEQKAHDLALQIFKQLEEVMDRKNPDERELCSELGKTWAVLDLFFTSVVVEETNALGSAVLTGAAAIQVGAAQAAKPDLFQTLVDFKLRAFADAPPAALSSTELEYCMEKFPEADETLIVYEGCLNDYGEVVVRQAYTELFKHDEGALKTFLHEQRNYEKSDIDEAFIQYNEISRPSAADRVGAGMDNIGTTCYIAAAIQLLRAFPDFKAQVALRSWNDNGQIAKKLHAIIDAQDRGQLVEVEQVKGFFTSVLDAGWIITEDNALNRANAQSSLEDSMEFVRWIASEMRIEPASYDISATTKRDSLEDEIPVLQRGGWNLPSTEPLSQNHSAQRLFEQSMRDEQVGITKVSSFTHLPASFLQSYARVSLEAQHLEGEVTGLEEGLVITDLKGDRAVYQAKAILLHKREEGRDDHYVTYRKNEGWYLYDDGKVTQTDAFPQSVSRDLCAVVWERSEIPVAAVGEPVEQEEVLEKVSEGEILVEEVLVVQDKGPVNPVNPANIEEEPAAAPNVQAAQPRGYMSRHRVLAGGAVVAGVGIAAFAGYGPAIHFLPYPVEEIVPGVFGGTRIVYQPGLLTPIAAAVEGLFYSLFGN